MRNAIEPRRGGFSLVELLVVIAIIGLIIALILVAAADGVRRAEERATQALITKLDTALNDRFDALLNTQAPINQTHRYLAAISYTLDGSTYIPAGVTAGTNSDDRRAQTIAQYDFLRAELPDVFFRNDQTSDGGAVAASYPLNFAGAPYPPGATGTSAFVLPLGNNSLGLPLDGGGLVPNGKSRYVPPAQTGIFGASFSAAAGIYKQLGYAKAGYDGVDNNGDGQIDEFAESGLTTLPANFANHTHKTARSEMLYALLVEGLSPLGSVFGAEDFTAREVQDTDKDGLLEFVDAWGEPLQFYRWPIYYGTAPGSSDSQTGSNPYGGFSDARQQDPLDPNQLLVSPAWWSSGGNPALTSPAQATFSAPNSGSPAVSQGAMAFMDYFHSLVDPNPGSTTGTSWDRGGGFARRAYFSRFLIVSGGPDKEPGVAQLNKDYSGSVSGGSKSTFPDATLTLQKNVQNLIYIENQAAQSDPTARSGSFYEVPAATSNTVGIFLQTDAALDDISNHNIQSPSTGVR